MKRAALAATLSGALVAAAFYGPAGARQQASDPVNNPTIDFVTPDRQKLDALLPNPMPPIPDASALQEFEVSATSRNRFGIDPASLLVRDKRIVQFTLVVTSPRGVRNIGYEAIDCEHGQVRLMAIGRDGHGWSPVQTVSWRPVGNGDTVNAQYRELARSWCEGSGAAGAAPELLRRLNAVPLRYR